MQKHAHNPAIVFQTYHPHARSAVEQRRRVIVALLHQSQHGLTAREIREALGFSKDLTASALSGLLVRGVLHKRGHCYVLAACDEVRVRSETR